MIVILCLQTGSVRIILRQRIQVCMNSFCVCMFGFCEWNIGFDSILFIYVLCKKVQTFRIWNHTMSAWHGLTGF